MKVAALLATCACLSGTTWHAPRPDWLLLQNRFGMPGRWYEGTRVVQRFYSESACHRMRWPASSVTTVSLSGHVTMIYQREQCVREGLSHE